MANIRNPRIVKNDDMESGQKVTWDCVYFGSYPQSEIKRGDAVYSKLEITEESEWNSNNDIIINGTKYRRMKKNDATYFTDSPGCYNWSDNITYHYFKYEPIKWRVLSVENGKAFILSDIALDNQEYFPTSASIVWDKSTLRSWLNGYGKISNINETDYSNKNFIRSAFGLSQEKAIENTKDKIFLLSESEVYGEEATTYGFARDWSIKDEARRCKCSDYAKAMGTWNGTWESITGYCDWLICSLLFHVDSCGYIMGSFASHNGNIYPGVRPALYLDLSHSDQYTYAGTVCSDGTVTEITGA